MLEDELDEDGLTDKQIEQQDYVDNAIYNLICDIVPNALTDGKVKWDIEVIGEIRDVIRRYYINPEDEQEFYPFMEI